MHIIDIADPATPKIVNQIQLEIQLPQNVNARAADVTGDGIFGYESHYCSVDRESNPTALACGYFQSGIRVFNVVDPLHVREIAYYNPPAQTGKGLALQHSLHAWIGGLLPLIDGSTGGATSTLLGNVSNLINQIVGLLNNVTQGDPVSGNLSADWCSSPPQFVNGQLWVTCMDNGFMTLKFTNSVYPIQ